jgi:hypothetical protein
MIGIAKLASFSVLVAAAMAAGAAVPASAQARDAKPVTHHTNRPLYDLAPQGRVGGAPVNSDDPSLTGGGSVGYNQNIYNW